VATGKRTLPTASDPTAVAERRVTRLVVPVVNCKVEIPRELIPYYVGVGVMTALELIDWPVALLIAAGHTVAARSHNRALRELGEGVVSGG
jgi:hypothetical protein